MERRLALFITFEGGEGAGKSTQANLLVERLRAVGETVVALREPGGTPLGDYLRDWLKASDRPLTAEAELLLFVAARAELVRSLIIPALAAEQAVVLDRYADSTTAYQGYGRGLPLRQVTSANALATGGLSPGLTVLLDAPPEATLQRALSRTGEDGERRFEDEAPAFHRRVRAGFLRLAKRSPERWLVLDAMESEATIHARVWKRVQRVRGN
jgi:dTMP kinase